MPKAKPEPKQRYLVAEVSQTWHPGDAGACAPADCVGAKFEQVCRVNAERGYQLHSWKMTTVTHRPLDADPANPYVQCIQETIVAVFELEPSQD